MGCANLARYSYSSTMSCPQSLARHKAKHSAKWPVFWCSSVSTLTIIVSFVRLKARRGCVALQKFF